MTRSLSASKWCALRVALLGCATSALPAQAVTYRVTIPDSQPRLATVDVTLRAATDTVGFSGFGATQFPEGWRKFVTRFSVRDAAQHELASTPLPNGRWLVPGAGGALVHLNYDVYLSHDSYQWPVKKNEAAYGNDWGVFYLGRALFDAGGIAALPDTVDVQFTVPKGWRVDTQWEVAPGNAGTAGAAATALTFRAPRSYLWASGLVMGHYDRREITVGNTRVVYTLGGMEPGAGQPTLVDFTERLLTHYTAHFGALPGAGRVLYVMAYDSTFTDGRAGAGVVGRTITTLAPMRTLPPMALIGLARTVTHEYMHLWNGWSLTFAGNSEEWFKEGVTEYYATLANRRLGTTDDAAFLARLRQHLGHYLTFVGRESPAAQGARKGETSAIVYSGGLAIGLALDLDIRERTQGGKSLDDFLRTALKVGSPLTNGQMIEGLRHITGGDYTDFFARYVTGTEPVPLERYLLKAGVEIVRDVVAAPPSLSATHGGGQEFGTKELPMLRRVAKPTPLQQLVWNGWVAP